MALYFKVTCNAKRLGTLRRHLAGWLQGSQPVTTGAIVTLREADFPDSLRAVIEPGYGKFTTRPAKSTKRSVPSRGKAIPRSTSRRHASTHAGVSPRGHVMSQICYDPPAPRTWITFVECDAYGNLGWLPGRY